MTDLRRSVLKRLARKASPGKEPQLFVNLCLKVLGYEIADIDTYENHASGILKEVFGASVSEVAKPKPLGGLTEIHTKNLPPVRPYFFKNVKIRSDSSVLWVSHRAAVPKHALENSHRFTWENGRSCSYEYGGRLYFTKESQEHIPKGICAFAQGAYNWYHWLIEVLPIVMLAQNLPEKYNDYPLLVPEEILAGATFRETLELYIGNREVIPLKKNKQYRIAQLIFVPPPVFGPFNMYDWQWPEPSDYIQNIGVMKQFRSNTLERLGIEHDRGSGPRRIFLARPPGSRGYNQDEIIEAALEKGFHIMRPEEFSFREQVQMFHNADYVIGPTGAACANTLFMRPGAKSLIWALKEYDGACFFSNLAHVSGSKMTYCFVDADTKVSSSYEAFGASYKLPVDVFTHHIDAMLSEAVDQDDAPVSRYPVQV